MIGAGAIVTPNGDDAKRDECGMLGGSNAQGPAMLARFIELSRHTVAIAVVGCLLASISLLLFEIGVVLSLMFDLVRGGALNPAAAKAFAVGMIEAVDVFLIAIALYIIGLGFYALFIDDKVKLPTWLKFRNLEDLKANLISVIVAVLAVMFLRQAIAAYSDESLLTFAASLSLIILVLTLFLSKISGPRE
jgi:uncharacterized membrane protein YqhA